MSRIRFTSAIVLPVLAALGLLIASRYWKTSIPVMRQGLLKVEPAEKLVADAQVNETVNYVFSLTNTTDAPLTVLGSNATCGCVVAEGLPMDLGVGETKELTIRMEVGKPDSETGRYSQTATLLLNREGPKVSLIVEASVTQ